MYNQNQQEFEQNNDQIENQESLEEMIQERAQIMHYVAALQSQLNHGANWFYWIAGLSVVNSILFLFNFNISFLFGLGITQVIDVIIYDMQVTGKVIGLFVDFILIGGFVLLGRSANKGHNWAFIFGMIVYAIDGAMLLLAQDWFNIAFHAYAIYGINKGFSANRELKSLELIDEES